MVSDAAFTGAIQILADSGVMGLIIACSFGFVAFLLWLFKDVLVALIRRNGK